MDVTKIGPRSRDVSRPIDVDYIPGLKIEVKLLLSASRKSYMPRRLTQQRMTLSDRECSHRALSLGWLSFLLGLSCTMLLNKFASLL